MCHVRDEYSPTQQRLQANRFLSVIGEVNTQSITEIATD